MEFQVTANISKLIAAKLSVLDDPEVWSYHPDGGPHPHTTKLAKKAPEETVASESATTLIHHPSLQQGS